MLKRTGIIFAILLFLIAPVLAPDIAFEDPTPPDSSSQTSGPIIINISLQDSNVTSIIYNWNGTNFTLLDSSTIGFYNFDNRSSMLLENSTLAKDVSLNNDTAYLFNIGHTTGKYDDGLLFTSSANEYANLGSEITSRMNGSSQLTISAWFNLDDVSSDDGLFYTEGVGDGSEDGDWFWNIRPGGGSFWVGYYTSEGRTERSISNPFSGETGNWVYLVTTYNGTHLNTYKNAILIDSFALTGTVLTTSGADLILGTYHTPTDYNMDGAVDDFMMLNRSLNQEEIYQYYVSSITKLSQSSWNVFINQSYNSTQSLDNGTYSYQFFSSNESQTQSSSARTLVIEPEDNSLSAENDSATMQVDTSLTINLTSNDSENATIGEITTPSNGSVVNNGDGTITYTPDNGFFGVDTFNYTIFDNGGLYNNATGHYYEYVDVGSTITWSSAVSAAAARSLYGLQGYLVTITSAAENTFVTSQLQGEGWLGASDSSTENDWEWVTGPENGTSFWSGLWTGSSVSGRYNNWASGEPNNAGDEDYAQFYLTGLWNDLPNSAGITGYVVEYGGMEGDDSTLPVGVVTITVVDNVSPNVVVLSPLEQNYSTNNISLNVSSNSTDANSWWYSLDAGNTNVTFTPNTSLNISDGSYFLRVYLNDSAGNINETIINIWINTTDSDGDGDPDLDDTLLYNESNVTASGLTRLNITVGGNTTNRTYSNAHDVKFYDENKVLMNFTHNFSSRNLDLSRVTITKSSLGLIVNLSEQLEEGNKKTLYIDDNSFVSLCVRDSPTGSFSEISTSCNGVNETDFTSCLGNNTGVSINNISCVDQGSTIQISNLTHSAILGRQATPSGSGGGGGGGGGGGSSSSSSPEDTSSTMNDITEDLLLHQKTSLNLCDECYLRYVHDGTTYTFSSEISGKNLRLVRNLDFVISFFAFGSKKVDLDSDGRDDLEVELEDIVSDKAQLRFTLLSSNENEKDIDEFLSNIQEPAIEEKKDDTNTTPEEETGMIGQTKEAMAQKGADLKSSLEVLTPAQKNIALSLTTFLAILFLFFFIRHKRKPNHFRTYEEELENDFRKNSYKLKKNLVKVKIALTRDKIKMRYRDILWKIRFR